MFCRAEVADPVLSYKFGSILEALCRGSGAYTKALGRQVVALGRLKDISEIIIQSDDLNKVAPMLR